MPSNQPSLFQTWAVRNTCTRSPTLIASGIRLIAAHSPHDKSASYKHANGTDDCPFRLARHKTAGKNANPLKEPDTASQEYHGAQNDQYCFHRCSLPSDYTFASLYNRR